MIARMLDLPQEKEQDPPWEWCPYKIDNRTVYDIWDQIWKDTDLYPYVKQHKSKRDGWGVYYAIHCPNHVNATASEVEMALQTSTYDAEKKAWNWEKYVTGNIKYCFIIENLKEYGYQDLDPGLKVWYLLNGIRCDKLFTAVATVRAHPDRYERDFDAIVAFLTRYINKKAPTLSVKVTSVGQNRPAKRQKTTATGGTFRGKIELKKYSREEYDSMSMAQQQQLYEP